MFRTINRRVAAGLLAGAAVLGPVAFSATSAHAAAAPVTLHCWGGKTVVIPVSPSQTGVVNSLTHAGICHL